MLEQIKESYGGDVKLALKASIESEITSPTTRAKLQWALEVINDLELAKKDAYEDGYGIGYDDGFSHGDAHGYAVGANDDW